MIRSSTSSRRPSRAAASRSTSSKYDCSSTIPCLTISASPERNSRSGRRAHGVGIHDDQPRLVKGPDQVLGPGMIDGGLAADRGVDLGQDRGRQRDEVHPAHVGGGDESGHVADRPTTETEDGGGAIEAGGQRAIPAVLGHGQGLGRPRPPALR